MPCRNRPGKHFAATLKKGAIMARTRPQATTPGAGEPNAERRSEERCILDAALLFRCMDMLRIDSKELAADDPLLYRELQGRCTLCRSRLECVEDLAADFDYERWVRWRTYCPNSTMLTAIGAVQNCIAAPQVTGQNAPEPRHNASPDRLPACKPSQPG
jgi:hypothetical protein